MDPLPVDDSVIVPLEIVKFPATFSVPTFVPYDKVKVPPLMVTLPVTLSVEAVPLASLTVPPVTTKFPKMVLVLPVVKVNWPVPPVLSTVSVPAMLNAP